MSAPRRPLGLFLPGGGARGAWQSGVLSALDEAGLRFDAVFAYSVGALNGFVHWLGLRERMAGFWEEMTRGGVLRLSPRLGPLSVFSDEPLKRFLEALPPRAPGGGSTLTVASLNRFGGRPVYVTADGAEPADFRAHLRASCAIPSIFPPVRLTLDGRPAALIDGGVPGAAPLDLAPLRACAEVLVLDMNHPQELASDPLLPWARWELACLRSMERTNADALAGLGPGPRVTHFRPERPLDLSMLGFRPAAVAAAFERGRAEARRLL
ncbi:MAG TPA: patatin-like phospholipase family protein [Elusimicrobiota bacterium]|nr:patatin-like phospholipase family protein [Elusimicrobiota bacterium]